MQIYSLLAREERFYEARESAFTTEDTEEHGVISFSSSMPSVVDTAGPVNL